MTDEEFVEFADETDRQSTRSILNPWKILIVDDEQQVHAATRYALGDLIWASRPLAFLSAYTAREALVYLREQPDVACVFLDVVMETDSAGLDLVPRIRQELQNDTVRIILRTGQPGYAPELDVIRDYDINDYRTKSELTRDRLHTSLVTALRSYQQLLGIKRAHGGLERIVSASSRLLKVQDSDQLARSALAEICELVRCPTEGFIGVLAAGEPPEKLQVLAGTGAYAGSKGLQLQFIGGPVPIAAIHEAIERGESSCTHARAILVLPTARNDRFIALIDPQEELAEIDLHLLRVFTANIAVGLGNALLFKHIEYLAYTDGLTGLPNRTAFRGALEQRASDPVSLAVILADVDEFQSVNDGLGHDIGDAALQALGQRLQALVRGTGMLARFSADCFALCVPMTTSAELLEILERIQLVGRQPFVYEGNHIPLSLTSGVALFPNHQRNFDELLKFAGIALKAAKRMAKGHYRIFEPRMQRRLNRRLSVIRELREADFDKQFELYYQPVVDLAGGQVIGAEALIRWHHRGELVMPADFIPAAEESGQIVPIGSWVLHSAVQQLAVWRKLGKDLRISINVSARQLREPAFFDLCSSLLAEHGIPPDRLDIEITESFMIHDYTQAIQRLYQARDLGFGLSIDDFGTGYSSLSYLHELPMTRLKIDRSFVSHLGERPDDRTICDLILQTGRLLKMTVLAEGVETSQQAEVLKSLGCDEAQGYFYARPVPAGEFLERFG